MDTDLWPPSAPGAFAPTYAATESGVWGPVVETNFVLDVDYRYIGNRGTPYHDVTTTSGAPVRVRTELAPYSLTAVVGVGGGSIVVTSYDLPEADLLQVVDGLRLDDNGAVVWDTTNLPSPLRLIDHESQTVVLTQYQLQRGDDEWLSLFSMSTHDWQMALSQRLIHPDGQLTEIAGSPALIYGYDSRSHDDAGAVYSDGELFYVLAARPEGPTAPVVTADEISEVLGTLEEVTIADLAADLGLRPRSEVVGAWLGETPLPEGVDLSWLLDGPPVSAEQEAFRAHQIFACAWAGQWIESGELAALDEIEASHDWPTAEILARSPPGSALSPSLTFFIDEARTITSLEGRRTSSLALDCGFLLGATRE